MADYAIGLSFHKAHRTLVRAVDLTPPCRYYATRDTAGLITLPTLDTGARYVEMQGITNTTFAINDNEICSNINFAVNNNKIGRAHV